MCQVPRSSYRWHSNRAEHLLQLVNNTHTFWSSWQALELRLTAQGVRITKIEAKHAGVDFWQILETPTSGLQIKCNCNSFNFTDLQQLISSN